MLDNLEQYQPWVDEDEVRQYDALAEAHGWDKSRFGARRHTLSELLVECSTSCEHGEVHAHRNCSVRFIGRMGRLRPVAAPTKGIPD